MGLSKEWYEGVMARQAAKEAAKNPSAIKPDDGLESELHEKVAAECTRLGWYFVHSRMDRKTTNALGVPDFLIWPYGYQAFAVECKSGTKKLTKEQMGVRAYFLKLKQPHFVVRSEAEFLSYIAPFKSYRAPE